MNNALRTQLTYAYQILSYLKLDDHTYTHLSVRSQERNSYFIYPFGLRFEEVTANNLLEIDLKGNVISGNEFQYNKTGYYIHGSIYKNCPNVNSIFHIHSPEVVAVSAYKKGLLPISQWALHFYEKVGYVDYNSLALSDAEGNKIAKLCNEFNTVLLRNHGAILTGKNIPEAMFYTYHLYQACKTQCKINTQDINNYDIPSVEICRKSNFDLLNFEKNLGERDWEAWKRLIDRIYKYVPNSFAKASL